MWYTSIKFEQCWNSFPVQIKYKKITVKFIEPYDNTAVVRQNTISLDSRFMFKNCINIQNIPSAMAYINKHVLYKKMTPHNYLFIEDFLGRIVLLNAQVIYSKWCVKNRRRGATLESTFTSK